MTTNIEDVSNDADETTSLATSDADMRSFVATDEETDMRLDRFLAVRLEAEGWSRARLQTLIEADAVLVNDKAAKSSLKLQPNDRVEIELSESPVTEFAPEDAPVEIIYEDDLLLVVNKPAGLVIHPGAGVPNGTLANRLAFHINRLSSTGGRARPGIVHRLDRDTSGLLVVAKTEATHEHLAEQFRSRRIIKRYTALVFGKMRDAEGTIELPIGRDPARRTRMGVAPVGRGGRAAHTRFRTLEAFSGSTLLDVEIKTGRTHQIRVHLTHIKHPVVGDETYAGNRVASVADTRERRLLATLDHQFLHAARLGFVHPETNEFMRFESPLPADLAALLDELRAINS